jgi:hypothetical protein
MQILIIFSLVATHYNTKWVLDAIYIKHLSQHNDVHAVTIANYLSKSIQFVKRSISFVNYDEQAALGR